MPSNKGKFQPVGVGMTPSKTELGSFIRARRIELNIKQVLLAQKVGLSQNLISRVEVGAQKYLNNSQSEQLAKALRCDVEELRKRIPVKHSAQPTTELGKFIRSRREELGLSLSAFAEKIKITPEQAKRLEVRKNPSIRYDLVKPLAAVLDLDPSVLGKFAGTTRKETKSKLGQLVRSRRKELGMSILMLAEKLNVSSQFVNQIEFGRSSLSESDDVIAKLAQTLELDANKLETLRPKRKMKQVRNINTLGGFLTMKRCELHLTQRKVSEQAKISIGTVCNIEADKHRGFGIFRIAKALNCSIPPELIPRPRPCEAKTRNPMNTSFLIVARLSDHNLADLKEIKRLSNIRTNSEVVRRALEHLRVLLEKQKGKDT